MIFQGKISVEFVDDFVAGENNRYHQKKGLGRALG
jgi:hypothetical protein